MKDSFGSVGYRGPGLDASDNERAGMAALVLVVNLCSQLKAAGVYNPVDFDRNFVNAVASSSPRLGSNLEQILYANLTPDSRESQDKIRGLSADDQKSRITALRREVSRARVWQAKTGSRFGILRQKPTRWRPS